MTKVKHETPDIYDLTYKRERCLCICYTLDCSKYWQIIKPAYLGKCHHLCKNWSNSYQNTMNVRQGYIFFKNAGRGGVIIFVPFGLFGGRIFVPCVKVISQVAS